MTPEARAIVRTFLPRWLRPRLHVANLVARRTGMVVQQGPFAGMRFEGTTATLPILIGTFERELWGVIAALPALGIRHVVNIGAADGYYAAGLARLLPEAMLVAFEADDVARATVGRVARLNHVADRIEIRGHCDPPALAAALADAPSPFILCDVEGYERELLDPAQVPALRRSRVLVELHDFLAPGASAALRARFGPTHAIEEIFQTPRSAADFLYSSWYVRVLPRLYRAAAVDEGREHPMSWFWMVPRDDPPVR